jgi:hypothetical protein
MNHKAIVIVGVVGVIAIGWLAVSLNVRYNRREPYGLREFTITRLFGLLGAALFALMCFGLSRFW